VRSVAFIGSAGVPNNYGGFEAFVEACGPELAARGADVVVTCDAARYQDRAEDWRGVKRLFVGLGANGAWSVLHDLVAFLMVLTRARNIVVLGVSSGVFFPLMRLLCALAGRRLIVNVDGLEWRRGKFGRGKRAFLWISDALAQTFAHRVIVDNPALRRYVLPWARAKTATIAYPGDHVLRLPGVQRSSDAFLTICRIEPENNCELLLAAFKALGRGTYRFVGNWDRSRYGRELREAYRDVPGLQMLDPIYDPHAVAELREGCGTYVHGHSVGGTNPSLVEMLFYDARVLAYDCPFNRETARGDAEYFATLEDLVRLLGSGEAATPKARRSEYTRQRIVDAYAAQLVLGSGPSGRPAEAGDQGASVT
jgi:glycosyltransferase involved in cell wall biosynthesis